MEQFEFDTEALADLSTESKRFILERQAEELQSIRKQANQTVRLFVAASALIIAFAQTSISNLIATLFSESPKFLVNPTSISDAPDPVALEMASQTRLVGITLLTIAGGFFFMSALNSVRVLRKPSLLPSSYQKKFGGDNEDELLSLWIVENDRRLTDIRRMERNTLAQIDYTIMFLMGGSLTLISVLIGMAELMFLLSLGAIAVIPAVFVLYVYRSTQTVNCDLALTREYAWNVTGEFFRLWNMRGPGILTMTLLLLFYGAYFSNARTVIQLWFITA